jgi:diguanylate cyclase (GGDEF)-like protein
MFERRDDPYAGADLVTSRRVVAAMLGLTALLSLSFFPLSPLDVAVGWRGWCIGGALVLVDLLVVKRIADRSRPVGFDVLLVVAYGGACQLAVLEWLAGGGSAAYGVLYMAWLGAGVVHPPRRAVLYLGALVITQSLPLYYQAYDSRTATLIFARAILLLAVGSILIAYLDLVRRQRVGLQAGAEVARRLARVDELTGLGNRRAFDEALTVDVDRARRAGEVLSVGLVDLDGLKRVNDGYGHLEGDRCLHDLARALEESVRGSDRCFRWAGDEFAVLLPGATRVDAGSVLERVAKHVRARCRHPDGTPLEISFGSGQLAPEISPEDLLETADLDLLAQKAFKRG